MLHLDAARRNPFAPGLFAGQVALVTGGGSGIGLCTARELLALGARVAIAGRKAHRRGAIVNVIAMIARGFPGMAHTGAARAGVENLTRSLAVEWAAHDVRCNAVAPGVIASSGTERYGEAVIEAARRAVPQKRVGTV